MKILNINSFLQSLIYNYNIMNQELESYNLHINFNNQIIYDIGANEGVMTNFFLKNSNNSEIIAVEPHKNNVDILKKKFKDTNITILDYAINTFDGTCFLGLEQQEKTNGLKQGHVLDNNKDYQNRQWEKTNKVNCIKLDTLCKNATIIKMDIEGFEHKILYNSVNLLSNLHTIMLEIHSWEDLENHGWTIKQHKKENDSLNKLINYLIDNKFSNIILAKKHKIKVKVDKNIYWTDIPLSSYKKNEKKVYYKVINLILKKL